MTAKSAASESYLAAFLGEVCAGALNDHDVNHDYHRFYGRSRSHGSMRLLLRNLVKGQLRKRGYGHIGEVAECVRAVEPHLGRFQALYGQLDDQLSRDLLTKLPVLRCLGPRRVKLPLDTPSYWEGLRRIEKLADKSDSIEIDRNHWTLFRMSLRSVGYPIDAYLEIKEAYTQFVLQQYRGDSERGVVQVEPTDYVIDAGAYHGDTALYFAHRSGPMGRVYSFESNPHSLEVMKRNLALNPELSKRVQIAERAVWGESGLTAYVQGDGPPSAVGFEKTARVDGGVLTLTIDDLAAQECLPRVDFIKMDIEGAELPALRGAVRTLRRFRPRLAIAVYHRPTDLLEVPEHIRSLDLGYRLFLRHFSIHFEETVLFAQTDTA